MVENTSIMNNNDYVYVVSFPDNLATVNTYTEISNYKLLVA